MLITYCFPFVIFLVYQKYPTSSVRTCSLVPLNNLLLYLCTPLCQILSGKITCSIYNITYDAYGKKKGIQALKRFEGQTCPYSNQ